MYRVTEILNERRAITGALPCASPNSSAQLPNSGSTCKVSMNRVSPRRRLEIYQGIADAKASGASTRVNFPLYLRVAPGLPRRVSQAQIRLDHSKSLPHPHP